MEPYHIPWILVNLYRILHLNLHIFHILTGIPTDEEQATGLEKVIMTAAKEGAVRPLFP